MSYFAAAGAAPVAAGLMIGLAAVDHARSVTVQGQLLQEWRQEIKARPPAERLQWLQSAEGTIALGAARCRQLIAAIHAEHKSVRGFAVSPAWIEAWFFRGAKLPIPTDSPERSRRGAVRLQWSRQKTRIGMNGKPEHRLTPPQAVELEDELDALTVNQATFHYDRPASPSAEAIRRIGEMQAKPVSGNW